MIFLAWISFYIMGFALVMSVVSIITAPIYLLIKHGENNVSMCAVFAVVDAILTVFACILLLPSFFEDTMASVFGKIGVIILIPTMIVCCIGAVIIDRVQYSKDEKIRKMIENEQEMNNNE